MSGVLPDRYAGKPEMVLTAMQMSLELGLKPLTGLCKIAVVKGTPTVFGDMPLAMVQASGHLESIKEIYFDDAGNEISFANKNLKASVVGALCVVKRKGDPEPREASFTLEEARTAGLLPAKPDAAWSTYPKLMMKYRARAQALKDKFPDALNGIAIGEYDQNKMEDEVIDVTPSVPQKTSSLEEKLKQKAEVIVEGTDESDSIEENSPIEVSND